VILSKSKKALDELSFGTTIPVFDEPLAAPAETPDFSPKFLSTDIKTVKEIPVHNRNIILRLRDYQHVDDDTVSIFLNRKIIFSKQRISKKQKVLNIFLNSPTDVNEIILFAENLGKIPPNTSELIIIDGKDTHRLVIESNKQKSAAVYLRYQP
jgi:hypothetical protein